MRVQRLGLFLLSLWMTAACSAQTPKVETVATGLKNPWNIAFLPDGRWLVTERAGQLRVIKDGKLQAEPVAGLPPVYAASQGGLFDVLLAPDFAESQVLYLSFAHGSPKANGTRVIRARLDGKQLTEVTPIFTASPLKDTPVHYGGRMAWDATGKLLLTLGDGFDYREEAQKLGSHFGAIVRLNPDGSVPADNPFVGRPGAKPEIFSYGHRNVQGLVVTADGRIYSHEHGPRGGDELNHIQPGLNYGWPAITYGVDYSGAVISPYTEMEGMEQPLIQWTPSLAISGMTVVSGERHAAWNGNLLISSLVERSVRRIELGPDGKASQSLLYQHDARLRDVQMGPDGHIYLLTDSGNGAVLRLLVD